MGGGNAGCVWTYTRRGMGERGGCVARGGGENAGYVWRGGGVHAIDGEQALRAVQPALLVVHHHVHQGARHAVEPVPLRPRNPAPTPAEEVACEGDARRGVNPGTPELVFLSSMPVRELC